MKASNSFAKKHVSELVFAVLFLFSSFLLAFKSGSFVVDFKRLGFSAASALERGVNAVAGGISGAFTAVHELAVLREENKALSERLKDYEYMQRSNTEIRKENERLREQLAFSLQTEQRNFPAQIIARTSDNLYSSFTINKGTRSGIRKNMPVIAVQNGLVGVVGKVVTVGATASMVMPVYDVKCNVSARIQNSRDVGLVSGSGNAENSLLLRYINKNALEDLHIGDIVVTSGENENYVRDIPIGTISKIKVLDYDSSLDIELVPVINFSRLETVIVTEARGEADGL